MATESDTWDGAVARILAGAPGAPWQDPRQETWQEPWQETSWSSGRWWEPEHQALEPTETERPSSSATGRPPTQQHSSKRQQFFGSLSQITKQALVSAVQEVQRCNILGDSLWKSWVEQLGAEYNDPNKYEVGFLEQFLHSCEGVNFCKEQHSKLAASIRGRA